MKQCHEISCVGCPCHSDKSTNQFSYGSYKMGDKVTFPTQINNLVFLVSGELSIKTHNSDEYICKAGQMILLSKNERYQIDAGKDSLALILSFMQSYQVCTQIGLDSFRFTMDGYKYSFHTLPANNLITEFAKSTIKYLKDEISCMHIHSAKQMELFIIMRFYYTERTIFSFFFPVIDKGILFQSMVRIHSVAANSVEEMAALCGYNINTFKKVFTTLFNESPYKWMLQQKANRIKRILIESNIPIKVIVAEFGFADQSHLNVFCKKYLGGTSVQIREGLRV